MEQIFGDLKKFGISSIASLGKEIFEDKRVELKEDKKSKKIVTPFNIDEYVYIKKYTCPVCKQEIESYVVRESKIKVLSIEFDLRPVCDNIEPLFYGVIVCGICGYSAVSKMFDKLTSKQAEKIIMGISNNFSYKPYPKEPTVEMAIERYKLALFNAMVKQAKDGEKAYICMKLTWLYRIKADEPENIKLFSDLTVKGFNNALLNEYLPIMGLEEGTILCLQGALYMDMGDNENAIKTLSTVIASRTVTRRLKDRARDLKNEILSRKVEEKLKNST